MYPTADNVHPLSAVITVAGQKLAREALPKMFIHTLHLLPSAPFFFFRVWLAAEAHSKKFVPVKRDTVALLKSSCQWCYEVISLYQFIPNRYLGIGLLLVLCADPIPALNQ